MKKPRLNRFVAALVLLCGLLATTAAVAQNDYVGSEQCRQCHADIYSEWQGSHHEQAMQPATAEFVLGDFSDVEFEHFGETTRFFVEDGRYFISALNADGERENFSVAYTFGFYPLQQYLLAGPGGRYQAFTVAWDSRSKAEGGQRWFPLYPNEATPPGDALHWTGNYFTWNNRCADCHSTNLQKNYRADTDSYATTWSEIDVACEACHGSGQRHIEWVGNESGSTQFSNNGIDNHFGFSLQLDSTALWLHQKDRATARNQALDSNAKADNGNAQISICGRCHSRRSSLSEGDDLTATFDQNYHLQLLQTPLYHEDGQIHDEVYVLGSFMQSKMFQQGVVCSDCHNPHSLTLKLPGNQVCAQCHRADIFDTPVHHHHAVGTEAGECISCHMPATTYMQVDPRRDHSLRIPRPDLSQRLGTPNACNDCHANKTPEWAARQLTAWLAETGKQLPAHFSELLAQGLSRGDGAQDALVKLAMSEVAPNIGRASAVAALGDFPSQQSLAVAQYQLQSSDANVRAAAVNALAILPPAQREPLLLPLLQDGSRLVRYAVVDQLLGLDEGTLTSQQRSRWRAGKKEYLESLNYHADSPAGQVNLALYHVREGRFNEAEQAYRKALAQNAYHVGAYLNLADLYRQRGDDDKGEVLLDRGLEKLPDAAALYLSAGLLQVRKQNYSQAEVLLAKAAALQPNDPRYAYTQGLILQRVGKLSEAVSVWKNSLAKTPDNRELLLALLTVSRQRQQWSEALSYAKKLQELAPGDPQIAELIKTLQFEISKP